MCKNCADMFVVDNFQDEKIILMLFNKTIKRELLKSNIARLIVIFKHITDFL